MLVRLKLVSNLFLELAMFACAGVFGIVLIPFVIGAAWLELFREAKDAWKGLGAEVPEENAEEV